jgi:protein involved in polysaccharide export with SLBB domain
MRDDRLRLTIWPFPKRLILVGSLLLTTVFPSAVQAQTADTTTSTPPAPDNPTTSTAAMINSMDALNDHTTLANGDRVSYRVIEERKDPTLLTISDSGELEIPLLGRYSAAGKTCKQLANELKPLLERDYFFKATVIVGLETLSTRPLGKVYLMGQVHAQGTVDIPATGGLTVSKAILINGGLADFADKRRVKLLRKKPDGTTETIVVDLVEVFKGHSEKDPALQPGDTINVPEKLINF